MNYQAALGERQIEPGLVLGRRALSAELGMAP
jgi:hypothetical protein